MTEVQNQNEVVPENQPQNPPEKVRHESVTLELPLYLTDADVRDHSVRLAALATEEVAAEEELKTIKAEFNARKLARASKRSTIFSEIRTNIGRREVVAQAVFNETQGLTWIEHAGQIFHKRALKISEYAEGMRKEIEAAKSLTPMADAALGIDDEPEAELVGSSDGNVTKLTRKGRQATASEAIKAAPSERDYDIQNTMREERNVKSKVDHLA